MDVHPDHQNKGLGRRLVHRVINWARVQKLSSVTLTTFETVPWNAPFYGKLGFRILAEDELPQELIEHLHAEYAQGLRQRVAMQRALAPA